MTKCICVWYWFIFLPYVFPFLKKLYWTINWWLCKQNITGLRRSVRKWKAETVQSDTVGYYHRSKLCCWLTKLLQSSTWDQTTDLKLYELPYFHGLCLYELTWTTKSKADWIQIGPLWNSSVETNGWKCDSMRLFDKRILKMSTDSKVNEK